MALISAWTTTGAQPCPSPALRYIFLFDKVVIVCKRKGYSYELKEIIELQSYKMSDDPMNNRDMKKVRPPPPIFSFKLCERPPSQLIPFAAGSFYWNLALPLTRAMNHRKCCPSDEGADFRYGTSQWCIGGPDYALSTRTCLKRPMPTQQRSFRIHDNTVQCIAPWV